MDLNLNNKKTEDLRIMLKNYDMVTGFTTLKKDELIKTIRAIHRYKNNIQTDYTKFMFGNKEIKLNDEQHKIVTASTENHMRVIAGAGSGKTTTMICRIKYIIDKGVDPERILLTTFNVDAAESMKNKIVELFGFMPKITIGTIDSIACKFYYRYFKQDHYVGISEYATYFLKYLRSNDNMISSIYKYIFFDEFQDVNETQFQILKEFYNSGACITVIGDDSQNIYNFRGSNIKYILNLEQQFKNLNTYKLVNNYRSTPEIINLANYSIKFNTEQIQKEMIPNHDSIGCKPIVKYYPNIRTQNETLYKNILDYHKQGIEYEEIAILCRVNYPLKLLEETIERLNCKSDDKIKYVALVNDDNSDVKPKIKPGHITLTSIHKSKGLEWKIVYILDCCDNRFPSETDKLSIQEERRLFYVATTRAKQYLFYLFSGDERNKSGKAPKLTRFLQEIKKSFYNFENSDNKFYFYDDARSVKWVTGVTETIRLLNEQDIAKLRRDNILPDTNPIITKLHNKYEFNSFITAYYLQSDFGEFIDRYITRSIGRRNDKSFGMVDNPTVIIISACQFTKEELAIYKKYEVNFNLNMKKINEKTADWKYCTLLDENDMGLENVRKIEGCDNAAIRNIINKIMITHKQFGIDINILAGCFNVKNDIPHSVKEKFKLSYEKYGNNNLSSNEIVQDIYNVSLSNTILGGRRRLIYKDVYNHVKDGYDNMFVDMDKYIETLNPEFTKLDCKKLVRNAEYDIMGEIDLVNIDGGKIIDFKCSSSDKFKLEWSLQLLTYLAIMRKGYPDIVINNIEVYNPMQGETYTIDVSNWNKEDELLFYLYEIRVRQITRNALENEEDDSNDLNVPMDYGCNTKLLSMNHIEKYYDGKNIYDFQKIFGDEGNDMLQYYNQNVNKFKQYDILIKKFNDRNNKKYMILDTETTGIPLKNSEYIGELAPYYEVEKYDNARMIQLCWAIYDNGKLIEIENYIIKPNGFKIDNSHIHGITDEIAKGGSNMNMVLAKFIQDLNKVKYIVGHNINFDNNIIMSELYRNKFFEAIKLYKGKKSICTMKNSMSMKINGALKYPSLINLYKFLFGKEFDGQHNAKFDVLATGEVCNELMSRGVITL